MAESESPLNANRGSALRQNQPEPHGGRLFSTSRGHWRHYRFNVFPWIHAHIGFAESLHRKQQPNL